MVQENQTESERNASDGFTIDRRWLLGALSAGGLAGLAGCGGGGDGGGTTTTTTTETTTTTTETTTTTTESDGEDQDGEDTTTTTTVAEDGIERYDTTVYINQAKPRPADTQYQTYGNNFHGNVEHWKYYYGAQSFGNLEFEGELIKDWNYQPGLVELELHEDHYFWNGENITADTLLMDAELKDFVGGGNELDAWPHIVQREKTGKYTVRYALVDTFRELVALQRSFHRESLVGSRSYYMPWVEKFRDAANQSEIEDLRRQLEGTTEKNPDPFMYGAFKIVDATSDKWILRLRTDEDPTPHFVDQINFLNVETPVVTERQRIHQRFKNQEFPWGDAAAFDPGNLDFETEQISWARPADQWSFLFNCSLPTLSNRHFRRAFCYMTNRKQYMRPAGVIPNKRVTPFMTPKREEKWVSSKVLDNLTDYGWDSVEREKATQEMKAGGFERDSQGRWLHQEGEKAGKPIRYTYTSYPWMQHVGNLGTDFRKTMSDWGLELTNQLSEGNALWPNLSEGNFVLATPYWGGGSPPRTMAVNFTDTSAKGSGYPRLPPTVEAPPVGESWTEYDGELKAYDTKPMASRLAVTRDKKQYQSIIDKLTWVYNQVVPRFGVEAAIGSVLVNSNKYDVPKPGKAPKKYTDTPGRRLWNNGGLEFVPEGG